MSRFTFTSHAVEIKMRLRARMNKITQDSAESVIARVEEAMRLPKSGRIYRRPGRLHQASAPGEAPAIDTGELLASGHVEETGVGDRAQTSIVYDAPYAGMLEFGTVKMAPRPFLGPAIEQEREDFLKRAREAI